jgi:hypothetical protein
MQLSKRLRILVQALLVLGFLVLYALKLGIKVLDDITSCLVAQLDITLMISRGRQFEVSETTIT